jgi:Protein of unknown function (DUF3489)
VGRQFRRPATENTMTTIEHTPSTAPDKTTDRKISGRTSAGPGKQDLILKKLGSAKGVTLDTLVETSGWQKHSVRGFLSGTVRKKLGLPLVSELGKDGRRRYRIERSDKPA